MKVKLTPQELGKFADFAAERIARSGLEDADDPDPKFVLEVAVEVALEWHPDGEVDDLARQLKEWVY